MGTGMDGGRTYDELARIARREHVVLERRLRSVTEFVEAEPSSGWEPSLIKDLQALHSSLRTHFKWEEESGLFRDLDERLPYFHHVTESLLEEHPRFLRQLGGVVEGLELHPQKEGFEAVRAELRRFLESYEKHEDTENDLLLRAYSSDLGSPD